MLRKDREITSNEEMIDILYRANTIRIALFDKVHPYIVPVSYGIKVINDIVTIYFHSAKLGHKIDLINQNNNVCVETDIFYKIEQTEHGITTRYESVIGYGKIVKVENDEKIEGLKQICHHYNKDNYPIGRCMGLNHTDVYKIEIESMTGKRNLG